MWISKWRPPPSWILSEVKSDGKSASGTPFWVSVSNLVQIHAIVAELLRFRKKKIQNGGYPPFWIIICYAGHPRKLLGDRKSVFKFHGNQVNTFEVIIIWKFHKYGLKRLFPPPKFSSFGVFDPNHHFSSSRPHKALPWPKTRILSPHTSQSVHRYGQDGERRVQKRYTRPR